MPIRASHGCVKVQRSRAGYLTLPWALGNSRASGREAQLWFGVQRDDHTSPTATDVDERKAILFYLFLAGKLLWPTNRRPCATYGLVSSATNTLDSFQ